jgi:hypothetical protein
MIAAVATTFAVGVPGASAAFGPDGDGQIAYGKSCIGKKGFVYQGSGKVGTSGVVKVWRNEATKQDCMKLEKVGATVGRATNTALVACSTSLKSTGQYAGNPVDEKTCQDVLASTMKPDHIPSDWGNYKYYAGTITLKVEKCLYLAAYTSTAPDSTPKTFDFKDFKDRESFFNLPGSGRWGC